MYDTQYKEMQYFYSLFKKGSLYTLETYLYLKFFRGYLKILTSHWLNTDKKRKR